MLSLLVALALPLASAELKYDVPSGWQPRAPASAMRVAEFTLPGATPEVEHAELVVYFFGGSGGSVEANLDRWTGQMRQPDDRASRDVAKTTTFTANGLNVTVLDVSGTYVAEVTPGAAERHDKPGYRLVAAVIQTPDGPYFVKLVGPAGTVARWADSVNAFLRSVRMAG